MFAYFQEDLLKLKLKQSVFGPSLCDGVLRHLPISFTGIKGGPMKRRPVFFGKKKSGKQGAELLFVAEDVAPMHTGHWSPVVSLPTRVLAQMQLLDAWECEVGFVSYHGNLRVPPLSYPHQEIRP